jgi:hypothetical protein
MDRGKQCLIITATITPNSNFVVNTDSLKRRVEYLDVLKYYVSVFLGDIYFVENSGFDFSQDEEFKRLFKNDNLFSICLPQSNQFDKGKGYQEFDVLDEVVSKLEHKYEAFIKVSGRYLTTNFTKLITKKNRGIIIDRHLKKGVAITSFFRCKMDFYQEYLKGCYKEVDDSSGIFVEHIVYKKLKEVDENRVDIFGVTPIYKGVSGSYGGGLNRHPLKTFLINIERKILRIKNRNELEKEFK